MPEGAIYVGRPTRWGNPCRITRCIVSDENGYEHHAVSRAETRGIAARLFREALYDDRLPITLEDVDELRGHDLACWCPLSSPCHADVLLEVANS
jgi:hypothetical protein